MEAIVPITIIFALLFLAAFMFSVYSNAFRGQNAMTRTAAYVSASGTWTMQQRIYCMRLRRGYVEVTVVLPSGARTQVRLPEKVATATVGVRTDADAVATIG